MYHSKIIILIGILVMSIGNVCAWNSETGLSEDELFDIMFNSPYLYQDINNPKWYNPFIEPINDWFVKFKGYFTHTPPDIEVRVQIKKMIWTGSYYVEDTDFIDLDSSQYFSFKANTSTSLTIPSFEHVKEVFSNNTDEFEGDNWKTVDIDPDHPDLLNVTVDVGADGNSLDFTDTGYYAFTNEALEGVRGTIESVDYGFALDGKGSGAGSGGIYTGINMYGSGEGDVSGMGGGFNIILWVLIPFIFMFAVLKLSMRMI